MTFKLRKQLFKKMFLICDEKMFFFEYMKCAKNIWRENNI